MKFNTDRTGRREAVTLGGGGRGEGGHGHGSGRGLVGCCRMLVWVVGIVAQGSSPDSHRHQVEFRGAACRSIVAERLLGRDDSVFVLFYTVSGSVWSPGVAVPPPA